MAFRTDSADAFGLAQNTKELMDEVVIPRERKLTRNGMVTSGTIADLRSHAREYGVYAPQISERYGGMGYDFRTVLPAFEEAGRSLLGPSAIRVDAPDQGNMHLLELIGNTLQKNQYLTPLVDGEIKSAISMTEPLQGGGSDPKMLKTTATRDGDDWIINGHKWWTTQGISADLFFVFARTNQETHPYRGCSIFLVPAEAPGVTVVRDIPHLGSTLTGTGHAEIRYENVRVPEEHLLGTQDQGFTHMQERLGPARLTHCMRYLGMATRALSVAKAYLAERDAFGSTLAEKQGVRFALSDIETELYAARTMVRETAAQITGGEEARVQVAMSKVFTANVVQRAVDTAVQLCGANGLGKDLPLADFYEDVRKFRIVDGADEVHKRTIAREAFRDIDTVELTNLTRYQDPS